MFACAFSGALVAAVGYADDVRTLSALPRLFVHVVAATVSVLILLQSSSGLFFGLIPQLVSAVLLIVAVVWSINLFNFMDGIDGIAASQAAFAASVTALLAAGASGAESWVMCSLLVAGASVGFLVWNWPPAKIFMGDVGSGFLGFWLAALAIALHVIDAVSVWTSVLLNSAFIADATTTLLRRIVRGERWHAAHRSHAYQTLARRCGSHRVVTLSLWMFNLGVILPLAYFTRDLSQVVVWIAVGMVLVLSGVCLAIGAGKSD
jgi:Fuc2NAc and GlcNAc transferase